MQKREWQIAVIKCDICDNSLKHCACSIWQSCGGDSSSLCKGCHIYLLFETNIDFNKQFTCTSTMLLCKGNLPNLEKIL